MQRTGTIYINFVGDHLRIIAMKFRQNRPSGSGGKSFKAIVDGRTDAQTDDGQLWLW